MYIKTSEYIICLNTDPSKHKLTESGHSTLNRDSGTRYECRTHKVKSTQLQCSNVYSKLALPNITHWICLPFPCPSLAPSNHTCQYHSGINELLKWAKLAHSIHTAVTKQSELLCLFFVHFKASPASWYFWTGLQTGMTVLFIWSVCLSLSAWLLQRSTNTDNAKQYCTVPLLPTNTTWRIHTYICTVHIHTHACTCMHTCMHTHTTPHTHTHTTPPPPPHTHTHYTTHTYTHYTPPHTHTHTHNESYLHQHDVTTIITHILT